MNEFLMQLEILAQEIIEKCKERLNEYSCLEEKNFSVEQNCLVINVILREFTENLKSIQNNSKVILLNPKRQMWSLRTIIDSAEFDIPQDNELFDKVRKFNKICQIIDKKFILFEYNY